MELTFAAHPGGINTTFIAERIQHTDQFPSERVKVSMTSELMPV